MKIVPNTERWNEGERDWAFVPNPEFDVARWEQRTGLHLPKDYRQFLLKFNGGSIYPRLFKHRSSELPIQSNSSEEIVDRLYRWDQVEKLHDGDSYGKGIPPGYLCIAETPGLLEILVSCNATDHGMIYGWRRSSASWGTGSNAMKDLLASSFTSFLEELYDDVEQSDHDNWLLPAYAPLIRELQFQGPK